MKGPASRLPLYDAGLQPERTALAWRRSALALAGGALVAVRIVPAVVGPWAYLPTGAGLVLAITLLVLAHRRYRRLHRALIEHSEPDRRPDGRLIALTAVTTLLIAGCALAFCLAVAGGGAELLPRLL
ncbi:DUF202 domain-containing protein [Herbiconiux sp. YIM B11900]|uniref:DUF202 domain-containing protein n=1 Tax=Herbiconiux sp. YIM B11900 TaxID=3404131 RepID=UPI003F843A89